MSTQNSSILVFSENEELLRELLGQARQKAAGAVAVALLGDSGPDSSADFASWGADTVYTVQNPLLKEYNPETYTDALAGLIGQVKPDLVLIGATKKGLEVAGRVAERLNLGCASWCVDFEIAPDSRDVTAKCMIYSGVGINTYHVRSHPALATVSPGVFSPAEGSRGDAAAIPVEVEIRPPVMTIIAYKEKAEPGRRLQDAPVIVDVGQGFKERQDLAMAEELARLLGGQVTCTRPVSSERDWFPEWLGLSGARLSPDLCFTVGVSGTIQHVIGIRDSKIIVGINNDENAAIFLQADYGVLADLYDFLPAMIEAIKTRAISQA